MEGFTVPGVGASVCFHDLPGAEPVGVFLHGLGSASSSAFPATARHPALAAQRAVLVDLLGFGFSDGPADFDYTIEAHADSVAALLEHLRLRDCQVVGHSMGGSVAILLAARHPHLVRTLVVAEGTLDPGKGEVSARVAAQSEHEYVQTGHAALLHALAAGSRDQPVSVSRGLLHTFRHAAPVAVYRSARSLLADRQPTFRAALEGLRIPRTYLVGERSLPVVAGEPLPGNGVTVAVVPNAGHSMMADNLDGFVQAIVQAWVVTPFRSEGAVG